MFKSKIIVITVFLIIVALLIVFVIGIRADSSGAKITFSGIGVNEQRQISEDLLKDETIKAQIMTGPGISLSREISNFCGENLDETCEYIECKIFTSQFSTDWIPCSLVKKQGVYSIERNL